jgi:predicted PurR-regulated permease PerM
MSFAEDEYVRSKVRKDPLKPFYPLIGFLLIVMLGAIAAVLSVPAYDALVERLDDIPPDDMRVQVGVGAAIFVTLLLLVGLIFAAFAPKQAKGVHERELKKEKAYNEQVRRMEKRRKQEINRKMAEERKRREHEQTRR